MAWVGPSSSSNSNPPAVGRDASHEIRLAKASSSLVVNTSRDGASKASLRHLKHLYKIAAKMEG